MDNAIRFAGIVDCKENTLYSKMNTNKTSLLTPMEEEIFAIHLQKIKNAQRDFDSTLGKTTFTYIKRDKLHQLIFHVDNFIIYVTCEHNCSNLKILKIASQVEFLIKNMNDVIYN